MLLARGEDLMLTDDHKSQMVEFVKQFQRELASTFEDVDGSAKIQFSEWQRDGGGGGQMGVIRGQVVEKAGVNVSEVFGDEFPKLTDDNPHSGAFWATGVSTINHMYNPMAPIAHMNVRMIQAGDDFWFGGGADLTPYKPFPEDTEEFHAVLRDACEEFEPGSYEKYSKWCDEYFFIKHRQSPRGVGGIFFDYLKVPFEHGFPFVQSVAGAYLKVLPRILNRRKDLPFTAEDKDGQLHWRGRYVEFNLVYDRGTHFGLRTGGNIDAILVSLPPEVRW